MIRDYSRFRLFLTKHAVAESIEDNLDVRDVENNINRVFELPELNGIKKRGIINIGGRYCTIIYKKKKHGLVIITCWESNSPDIKEYKRGVKEK